MSTVELLNVDTRKGLDKAGRALIIAATTLPPMILVYLYAPIPEDSIVLSMMVVYFWISGIILTPLALLLGHLLRGLSKS